MKGNWKISMPAFVWGLVGVGLLLWLCPTSVKAQSTMNVGTIGLLSDAPVYIALEKGYFKEVGIDAKLQFFAGGAEMMAPLAAGHLQGTSNTGYALSFFNGIIRGMPIKLVASTAVMRGGFGTLMISPDLNEKMRTVADLKGKKFAVNTAGSPIFYALGKTLESAGLKIKDVEVVYVPFPDMGPALKNKAIDAAFLYEPLLHYLWNGD